MKPIEQLKDVFITDTEFELKYKPILNHFVEQEDDVEYKMFETFGKEYAYVYSVYQENPNRVWTYQDGNNDLTVYTSRLRGDAIGYVITEIPFSDDEFITVLDDFENPVRYCYTNAQCPDCNEMIPFDVEEGNECSNCGHVFTITKECD
jgi:hypothetical protein